MKDICWYNETDLKKDGKLPPTAWDNFSYTVQQAHNVWAHINAMQEANRLYDQGIKPKSLTGENLSGTVFSELVDKIFSIDNKDEALALIEHHSRYFTDIPGIRGTTGLKQTTNVTSKGSEFFTDFEYTNPTVDKKPTTKPTINDSLFDGLDQDTGGKWRNDNKRRQTLKPIDIFGD